MKKVKILRGVSLIIDSIIGHIVLAISYITPRNKNKFVFGCKTGFRDNPKYLYLELQKNTSYKVFWYAKTLSQYNELKSLGLPVVCKYSLSGLYHLLTASCYFSTHNDKKDYCEWTSGNAKIVVLWHGVGIKALTYKRKYSSPLSLFLVDHVLHTKKNIDAFLVTSDFMASQYIKYKKLSKDVFFYASYPRCDFLKKNKEEIKGDLKSINDESSLKFISYLESYKKVYIYLPTWRDNGYNFLDYAHFDFNKMNDLMKSKNSLFVMKLHPNTNINLNSLSSYSNICVMSKDMDLYPILPFTDCLITDYSSVYYDYLYMDNKEILLYLFDLEKYKNENRGLVMDINEAMPGVTAYSFNEMIDIIKSGVNCYVPNKDIIKELFWGKADKSVVELICNDVIFTKYK